MKELRWKPSLQFCEKEKKLAKMCSKGLTLNLKIIEFAETPLMNETNVLTGKQTMLQECECCLKNANTVIPRCARIVLVM